MSIERRAIDTTYQSMKAPSFTECGQIMDELQEHTVLPYSGPRSVQVLQERFHGTLLADVFLDFPEGGDIEADELSARLSYYLELLYTAPGSVIVGDHERKGKIVFTEEEEDKVEDIRFYPRWIEAANRIRSLVHTAVPGMGAPDAKVVFTPRLKNSDQLVLDEDKSEWVGETPENTGLDQYHLFWHQYRVVERHEDGKWRERGALSFFSATSPEHGVLLDELSEEQKAKWNELFRSDQFDIDEKIQLSHTLTSSWAASREDRAEDVSESEEGIEEEARPLGAIYTEGLLEKHYPAEFFNEDTLKPNPERDVFPDGTGVERTIYASLSYALLPPERTGI